jgi:triacylglycerol lipase
MTQRSSRHLVDPQLLPFLELLPPTELSDETIAEVRARDWPIPPDPELDAKVAVQVFRTPGPAGAPDVGVVCYRPKAASGALPCIFHIHGGGYVGGKVEGQAPVHKAMVLELGCAIVTVGYRLAPETPFPGPVEDCYAALAWLNAHPDLPDVDLSRTGVMGESAGGGLAAALALMVRDRGEYRLGFQHLIYPMLDDRTSAVAEDQAHPYAGEYVWTHQNNRYGWTSLLGHELGRTGVSPYAAPARAENLAGLPPTYISTGSLDLFLEEDLDYARRLLRAGVPTELHVYPGGFHAFDFFPGVDVSLRAVRDSRAALMRVLHPAAQDLSDRS